MSSQSAARQLVIISTVDWDFLWQRHHVWATEFAQAGWQVFFVENTGFRNPRFSDWSRLRGKLIRRNHVMGVSDARPSTNPRHNNITVISPFVFPPNGWVFRVLNRAYGVPNILKQLKKAGLNDPNLVLAYLPSWTTLQILDSLGGAKVVFDCVANFEAHPDCPKDFTIIERKLLQRSSMVLTDSYYLFQQMNNKHANVHRLHHGVKVTVFNCKEPDVSSYTTTCFFGAIDHRIDWDAVKALLRAGIKVHMIGPQMTEVPNGVVVHNTLSSQQLASEVCRFDSLIIPYRKSEFSKGIIPAKLYECLATGKPTLTSGILVDIEVKDLVYECGAPNDFVAYFEQLSRTETADKRQRRREVADRQSTERNFGILCDWIGEMEAQ